MLSDYLTRRGIAVLRADDRGVGKSGGNFAAATTVEFATDAEAGVAYLQTRSEVDRRKIGLVGHSEGGVIAPMVAARNPAVTFIVLMAGSGVPGDDIVVSQTMLIAEAAGVSRELTEQNAAAQREILTIVKEEKDNQALDRKLRGKLAGKVPPAQMDAQIRGLTSPWYRYFIAYDPAPVLTHVTCPVLAIGGEKDLQVPARQNLAAIRKALEAGGNTHAQVEELPGLNHLFQTAKTGSPSEYAQIEETMSPVALDTIARWIAKQ